MNTKIYKVTTCKFNGTEKLDGVCRMTHNGYIDRYCVLDPNENVAIDIFTNEIIVVLTKTEDNKIASKQKVNLEQEYAVYMQELKASSLSKRERSKIIFAYFKFLLSNKFKNNQQESKQNVLKR